MCQYLHATDSLLLIRYLFVPYSYLIRSLIPFWRCRYVKWFFSCLSWKFWVHRVEIALSPHMYQYLHATDALLLIRYLFVPDLLLDVAAMLNDFFLSLKVSVDT